MSGLISFLFGSSDAEDDAPADVTAAAPGAADADIGAEDPGAEERREAREWEPYLTEEYLRVPQPNPFLGSSRGVSPEELRGRMTLVLGAFRKYLAHRSKQMCGYPYNLNHDCEELQSLLQFSLNNLGDPQNSSNYGIHSRPFEMAVVNFFCEMWGLARDEAFGYVTNSGSEGNMYGIYVGRSTLEDGVVVASEASHYSVFKYAAMFRMDARPVKADIRGEIDYEDLAAAAREIVAAGRSVILNVNLGTTVKGAVDDAARCIRVLREHGVSEDRMYVHVDGALFALCSHFVEHPKLDDLRFDRLPISSYSVSGHKQLGSPMPCGVVVVRSRYTDDIFADIKYLNSRDSTIQGSRNGHSPVFCWYQLMRKVSSGELRTDVDKCFRFARYVQRRMVDEAGARVLLNELSTTVVFELPPSSKACDLFVLKWQIACEDNIGHIVCMPSHTRAIIDAFVDEYVALLRAAPPEERRSVAAQMPQ